MTHEIELDIESITWVKSEIDQALNRAGEALAQASESVDDDDANTNAIRFAKTHIHQARGALAIVGLDGLAFFVENIDQLLTVLCETTGLRREQGLTIAQRALVASGNYLEEVVNGAPDQPLRLAALYSEIVDLQSNGKRKADLSNLFFPDLNHLPIFSGDNPIDPTTIEPKRHQAQVLFEHGLFDWLTHPEHLQSVQNMCQAVSKLEILARDCINQGALWWSAQGFLEGLYQGALPNSLLIKKVCAGLHREVRHPIDPSYPLPVPLMRSLLYWVGQTSVKTGRQKAIKDFWELDTLFPDNAATVTEISLTELLKLLRSDLATINGDWSLFCSGQRPALRKLATDLKAMLKNAEPLDRPALFHLLRGIGSFIAWLRKDARRFNDTVAIEIAGALLLCETALNRSLLTENLETQVSDSLARLRTLMSGEKLQSSDASFSIEFARQALENEARLQVIKEIQHNLFQIEQTLDDFFRNQTKRSALGDLAALLHQIGGALQLLDDTQAVELVDDAVHTISNFTDESKSYDRADFEQLAKKLSALGFYVEALKHGPHNLDSFLDPVFAREAVSPRMTTVEATPPLPVEGVPLVVAPPSPAAHLAATDLLAEITADFLDGGFGGVDSDFAADQQAPEPELETETASEVAPLLPPEVSVEELVATPENAPEPVVLATEDEDEDEEEEAFEAIAPVEAAAPEASPDTVEDIELDEELLAIFLEEAEEVLATIDDNCRACQHSEGTENLVTIRRGFHTLKGSGRMVGLTEFGEAAWCVEQTLNYWLQLEWSPTPALLDFITEAHHSLSAWATQIQAGKGVSREVSMLFDHGEKLRSIDQPVYSLAEISPPQTAGEEAMEGDSELATTDDEDWNVETGQEESGGVTQQALTDAYQALEQSLSDTVDLPALPEEEDAPSVVAPELSDKAISTSSAEMFDPGFFDHFTSTDSETVAYDALPGETDEEEVSESIDVLSLPGDELTLGSPPEDEEESAESIDLAPLASETDEFEDLVSSSAIVQQAEEIESVLPASELAPAPTVSDEDSDWLSTQMHGEEEFERVESLDDLEASGSLDDAREEAAFEPETSSLKIGEIAISQTLFDLYLGEAHLHLQNLRADVDQMQRNPTALPSDDARRAVHTLAGISGTIRLPPPAQLARAIETAFDYLRDEKIPPTSEQAALFETAAIALETMVIDIAALRMPLELPELETLLTSIAAAKPVEMVEQETVPSSLLQELEHEDGAGELTLTLDEPNLQDDETAKVAAPAPALIDEIDDQLLPVFLEESSELLAQLHTTLRACHGSESNLPEHLRAISRLLHTLKGGARMAGAMNLGEHIHLLETSLETADSSNEADKNALLELLENGLDQTETMIVGLGSDSHTTIPDDKSAASEDSAADDADAVALGTVTVEAQPELTKETAFLRVQARQVDRFVDEAGEIGISRARIEGELRTVRRSLLDLTENVIRLRNQLREIEIQAEVQMRSRRVQIESHHDEFDPLEMDRFTRLQELTRMMAESVGDVITVQQGLLKNLDNAELSLQVQSRLSHDLQQELMHIRMEPFDSLANRLHRTVRQSAKDLGKRATLDIRGGRIEIDRSVLAHMTAPLEHLLRNAIAHGIESPEVRERAGKPSVGTIRLSVSHEGNEIAITLTDDGAGLDYAAIAETARKRGLLGVNEQVDKHRLANLIFQPGFSTSSNLSIVSGRGIGMDVVKSETLAVGGRINIDSTPTKGTEFHIRLPLTLAVTQALLVRAGASTYAVPSSMITQVVELRSEALAQTLAAGGIKWHGNFYPYHYLPHLLGDYQSELENQRFNWVLLTRAGNQFQALHVDSLRGNQEIVVKNAGPQLVRIIGITGATVLGDGEIVLILNPIALASHVTDKQPLPGQIRKDKAEEADRVPLVMIVDDSLTVRKVTSRLLEREGFVVITAKDGADALDKLADTVPDVILSDIEMPRMDGFDLLRNIRADARTEKVPVIMITSRLADKHREHAREIGANNYLGKPFDEEELLGLLRDYTQHITAKEAQH